MSEFKQDQFTARQEELRRQSDGAFQRWLGKHPEVVNCTANRKMFENYR